MSYEVTRTADGRPQLSFAGEPPYCHALQAAPATRESELDRGRWLVVVFASWSVPDLREIQTALDAVKHFGGAVQLGVRPFDLPEEHRTWCPGISELSVTPGWLMLEQGAVRFQHGGAMSVASLIEAIQTSLLRADRGVAP